MTAPKLQAVPTAPRRLVSKTLRFEVFKRDSFRCQYCGATPPEVVLEIDHVTAVSSGCSSEIDNLVTACFNCNRGKGKRDLAAIPQSLQEKAELAEEKRLQLAAYERVLKRVKRAQKAAIDRVVAVYERLHPEWTLNELGRRDISRFLQRLPPSEVADAMEIAILRIGVDGSDNWWRYFCGICWSKIREGNDR